MIETDILKLKIRCTPNYDDHSNKEVVKKLVTELVKNPVGNKLACNQIGITDNRVILINIEYPLYLINPRILKTYIPILGISDCLSFPQKILRTYKFASIIVEADNLKGSVTFGIKSNDEQVNVTDPKILRCFAIQHCVDLINGITMLDREYKDNELTISQNNNHYVMISPNGKTTKKILKTKITLIQKLIEQGWQLKK
jgi:peptide deformylase